MGNSDAHDNITGHYCGHSKPISCCCRDCNYPSTQSSDPDYECEFITQLVIQELTEKTISTLTTNDPQKEENQEKSSQGERAVAKMSQHPLINAYWSLSFGGSPGGIHTSCPYKVLPEMIGLR